MKYKEIGDSVAGGFPEENGAKAMLQRHGQGTEKERLNQYHNHQCHHHRHRYYHHHHYFRNHHHYQEKQGHKLPTTIMCFLLILIWSVSKKRDIATM